MPGKRSQLTDEIHRRLVEGYKLGGKVKEIALYAGISTDMLYSWLARGRNYNDHLEMSGVPIAGEHVYWLLWQDCEHAKAETRLSATGAIKKAWVGGDWRAALAYLERTDPQEWGRVNRVEMTGADGGPLRVADVTETETRLAESVRLAVEKASLAAAELEKAAVDAEIVEEPRRLPGDDAPPETVLGQDANSSVLRPASDDLSQRDSQA